MIDPTASTLTQAPRRAEGDAPGRRSTAQPPIFDVHALRRRLQPRRRGRVPARTRRRRPARPTAASRAASSRRDGGDARLQRPRAAHPRCSSARRCVGCMTCVNACPDTAILGIALPESAPSRTGIGRLRRRRAGSPVRAAATATPHFADDAEVRRGPGATRPRAGGLRHLRRPDALQGLRASASRCARALGYDALRMIDKVGDDRDRRVDARALRARHARSSARCRRRRAEYRNEKALADLMLGEHALGYVGGAGSCSGCGEATAIRMLVAATRQVHGAETMGIVAATGCNTVFGSTYPYNPYLVPWTNSLFENAPADRARHPGALGPGRATSDRRLWVDRRRRRDVRHRVPVALADGRVGRRRQGARARHAGLLEHRRPGVDGHRSAARSRSCRRSATSLHGRPERRKELGRILMAHGEVYVAQTTPAHVNHFYRAVIEANAYPGPGRDRRVRAVPARARHRRRRVEPPGEVSRSTRARSRSSPTTRGGAPRCASGCRSRATRRSASRLVTAAGRDGRGLPRRSPGPRAASRRTSRPTARRRRRSRRPRTIASRTGARSRSSPACARSCLPRSRSPRFRPRPDSPVLAVGTCDVPAIAHLLPHR